MSATTGARVPAGIELVLQEHDNSCGIACVAMIASVSYREAWQRLAPPPADEESAGPYHRREADFLNEKGWWPSAQLALKTVIGPEEMDAIIESEARFNEAVESSNRLRLVLAFSDGTKPDHSVVWDRNRKDVVFDPSRGVIPISELFEEAGPQTYSGTLGFTAFRYQPGQPILALIRTELGFES